MPPPISSLHTSSKASARSRPQRRLVAVTGLTYAILVLLMWCKINLHSGFAYETSFPYMSETSRWWWSGFFYLADPLRINTSTFYHLSYLLGELVGAGGSYVPYQVTY